MSLKFDIEFQKNMWGKNKPGFIIYAKEDSKIFANASTDLTHCQGNLDCIFNAIETSLNEIYSLISKEKNHESLSE